MAGPMMGHGHGHGMRGKGSKNPKKTLGRLLSYLRQGYSLRFGVVLICIVLSAVTSAYGATFIRRVIDDYITPMLLTGENLFGGLLKAIAGMAAIYGVGVLATFLYNFLMVGISQGILRTIREQMFDRLQTLPLSYFDSTPHGDVMSHFTNDTDTLQQMLSQAVPQMFVALFSVLSVLVAMLANSVWLTLFVLLGVALMIVTVAVIGARAGRFFGDQQRDLGAVNGYVEEMIAGQKVIKVFCREDKTRERFDELNDALCHSAKNANQNAIIIMPIMGNLGNLLYVLVAVFGGALALSGRVGDAITIGVIATFMQLTKSFIMPINQISQQMNAIVMALAGAERIFELMDRQPEIDEGQVTLVRARTDENGKLYETEQNTGRWAWKLTHEGKTAYRQLAGDVRFEKVDFGYTEGKTVLHDISLFAEPGQKVAFVGATGAGKTTITNLINRFYDIQSGSILYDGIPIRDIKKDDLRHSLGIVLQDVNLFSGTIRENIRYGRLDATDAEVEQAAKRAGADSFITRLPEGYDTEIDGEGGSLSQGQRQLLAIARAAVADPPVMILDEATSSIDTRTEAIVQAGMDALMQGRTVFVIAHRLSTVQNADVIMVLEQGEIIERGTHEQLIAARGKYYQLYTGAFELE